MPSSFGNCVPRSPLEPGLRRARLLGALALIDHWPRLAACLGLRAYRCLLSPVLGGNCRFEPSCSAYAEQAIERHGCGGVGMAIRRLLRCHPWGGPGGFDPVL